MWIFILVGFFLRIFMYLFGCTGSCITRGLLLWSTDSLVVAQGLSCSTAFFVAAVQSLSPTLCDLMDCTTPGFPVLHHLPEFAQTYGHPVRDAIQPSHPLSSLSPPASSLFQHQGLFQGVSSSHQVAKVLEFQLQHQSFQ